MGLHRTCNGVYCRLEGKVLLLTPTAPLNPEYKDIHIVPAWLYDTDPFLQSRIRLDLSAHDSLEGATREALREYEGAINSNVAHMHTKLIDGNVWVQSLRRKANG